MIKRPSHSLYLWFTNLSFRIYIKFLFYVTISTDGMYNKLIQINLKMIDVNSFCIIIVMCLFWHFHSYYLTRKDSIIPIQIIQNHFLLGIILLSPTQTCPNRHQTNVLYQNLVQNHARSDSGTGFESVVICRDSYWLRGNENQFEICQF